MMCISKSSGVELKALANACKKKKILGVYQLYSQMKDKGVTESVPQFTSCTRTIISRKKYLF